MSIHSPVRSSKSIATGVEKRHTTEASNRLEAPRVEHHGYPTRQAGICYGHSSGYATRDSYNRAGSYVERGSSALFRFH